MSDLPPHDWHSSIILGIVGAYGRAKAPALYIEIGVDRGHTLAKVAQHFMSDEVVCHGVDVTFDNLAARYNFPEMAGVILHQQTSDDFFSAWRTASARAPHVVFIDGDHRAEQVQQDIYNALSILAEGGTIIVHDTFPEQQVYADSHCGDGWAAVDQFRQQGVLQVFTLPLFPGLTLIGQPPELCPK